MPPKVVKLNPQEEALITVRRRHIPITNPNLMLTMQTFHLTLNKIYKQMVNIFIGEIKRLIILLDIICFEYCHGFGLSYNVCFYCSCWGFGGLEELACRLSEVLELAYLYVVAYGGVVCVVRSFCYQAG